VKRRVAVFGCKQTTAFMIDALREHIEIHVVVTIAQDLAAKNEVADYVDLTSFLAERGIPAYVAKSYGLKDAVDRETIRSLKIDVAFVIGWQRLIPPEILAEFSIGAFGMHGSADGLPRGRGRSPMNWALIEGRDRFETNLFRYDAGIDSGAVADTVVFSILPSDTAETLHFKNALAMKRLILRNLDALIDGSASLEAQRDDVPTFYPKREPGDSIIDWRNDIAEIDRFIRAVAPPFNGAFSFVDGKKVTIDRAAIFELDGVDFGHSDAVPGTIVEIFPNGKWLVRASGGLLIVHESRSESTLHVGARCVSPPDAIREFPTNERGGHDLP